MGAVVAPVEAHTVLLLVEQVAALIAHSYSWSTAGGAGGSGHHRGSLHFIM